MTRWQSGLPGAYELSSTSWLARLLLLIVLSVAVFANGAAQSSPETLSADTVPDDRVDAAKGPSPHRALLGLLENERRAIEQQIERVTGELRQLTLSDRIKDPASLQEPLEKLQRELIALEQRMGMLKAELVAAKDRFGEPEGPAQALVSEESGAEDLVFIPAFRPNQPAPARDLIDVAGGGPYPLATRLQIQEALIFLGGYDSTIDGDFGKRTEQAIRAFQETQDAEPTGRLTETQKDDLLVLAASQRQAYGVRTLQDDEIGYSFSYPSELLTEDERSGDGYRVLKDGDGLASLQVVEIDSRDLKTMFDDLTRRKGAGYRHFAGTWFVATGEFEDDMFYGMGRRANGRSIVVYLTYPVRERDRWDPFSVILYNSFKLTDPGQT